MLTELGLSVVDIPFVRFEQDLPFVPTLCGYWNKLVSGSFSRTIWALVPFSDRRTNGSVTNSLLKPLTNSCSIAECAAGMALPYFQVSKTLRRKPFSHFTIRRCIFWYWRGAPKSRDYLVVKLFLRRRTLYSVSFCCAVGPRILSSRRFLFQSTEHRHFAHYLIFVVLGFSLVSANICWCSSPMMLGLVYVAACLEILCCSYIFKKSFVYFFMLLLISCLVCSQCGITCLSICLRFDALCKFSTLKKLLGPPYQKTTSTSCVSGGALPSRYFQSSQQRLVTQCRQWWPRVRGYAFMVEKLTQKWAARQGVFFLLCRLQCRWHWWVE